MRTPLLETQMRGQQWKDIFIDLLKALRVQAPDVPILFVPIDAAVAHHRKTLARKVFNTGHDDPRIKIFLHQIQKLGNTIACDASVDNEGRIIPGDDDGCLTIYFVKPQPAPDLKAKLAQMACLRPEGLSIAETGLAQTLQQIENFQIMDYLAVKALKTFHPDGRFMQLGTMSDIETARTYTAAFTAAERVWKNMGGAAEIPEYFFSARFLTCVLAKPDEAGLHFMLGHLPMDAKRDCWRGLYYELLWSHDDTATLYDDWKFSMSMSEEDYQNSTKGYHMESPRLMRCMHDLVPLWERTQGLLNGLVQARFDGDLRQHAKAIAAFDTAGTTRAPVQTHTPDSDDLMTLALLTRLSRAITVLNSRVLQPQQAAATNTAWALAHHHTATYMDILGCQIAPEKSPVGAPRRPALTHVMVAGGTRKKPSKKPGTRRALTATEAAVWHGATPPPQPN